MQTIQFKNKRGKSILSLQWNKPNDILAWAAMIRESALVEFKNVDANVPITLQGDDVVIEKEVKPSTPLSKEDFMDVVCGVKATRPTLDWKRINRDSFMGKVKRDVELPEFHAKYKMNYKNDPTDLTNYIGKETSKQP